MDGLSLGRPDYSYFSAGCRYNWTLWRLPYSAKSKIVLANPRKVYTNLSSKISPLEINPLYGIVLIHYISIVLL